jgi:hypothetical protein
VVVELGPVGQPGDRHLMPVGVAYELKVAETALTLPYVTVGDSRKVGIYRQDETDPAIWHYVGGRVSLLGQQVSVNAEQPGIYAVMAYERSFSDLAGHWGQSEVEVLVARHLVLGTGEDSFEPDRVITRAELATLLVRMAGAGLLATVPLGAAPRFGDVAPDAWYFEYVETAARLGLVQGADGQFRPNDPVSRQEMAIMLLRAMGESGLAQGDASLAYDDVDSVADWALGYVARASELGLMQGTGPGIFAPLGAATRAQAAVVLLRALEIMGLLWAD